MNAHWSNRGDEAALRALLDTLLEEKPEWKYQVIFKDKKEITNFPYENIPYFSAQFLPSDINEIRDAVARRGETGNAELSKEVRTLADADLIIYSPGGAVISDHFWWRKNLEYLVPFLCAEKYGIPIVTAAPSMGPFQADIEKEYAGYRASLLKKAGLLIVRENKSAEYLSQIGVKDNVSVTVDTAFLDDLQYIEPHNMEKADRDLEKVFAKYNRVVGMTVTDFAWHVKYGKIPGLNTFLHSGICDFIKYLEQRNIGVIFIPQLFGNQDDWSVINTYAAECTNTFILSQDYDTYTQQYAISKLYAIVGMRYHSNIFAAKTGVPFIAVSYEDKMKSFMETWGYQDYMVEIDGFHADILKEKFAMLEKTYQAYKFDLEKNRKVWRALARKTVDEIERYM